MSANQRLKSKMAHASATLEKKLFEATAAMQNYIRVQEQAGESPNRLHLSVDSREVLMRDMKEYAEFLKMRNRLSAAS